MRQLNSSSLSHWFSYTGFAGGLLIATGLGLFLPAFMSIGVALVFLHPYLNLRGNQTLRDLTGYKPALLLVTFYLLTVLSFFYTGNREGYWQDISMKLPFLLLPFGLMGIRALTAKQVFIILFVLISGVWVTGVLTFIDYLSHFKEYNEALIHSTPILIFTGINHIYYSFLLAFSAIAVLYAFFHWYLKTAIWKWIGGILLISFLLFIHTISSRTGIATFYSGVLVIILWYIITRKAWLKGGIALASAILLAVLAFVFITPLQNRLQNTATDISKYFKGENINYYSVSMRFEALETSFRVFKSSPIAGVGPADIEQEMHRQYELDKTALMKENWKLPHHQFLQTLTTLGIMGFLVLLALFILPLFDLKAIGGMRLLFLLFLAVMFVAFQVESVLERQVGITFFTYFYLLFGSFKHKVQA